MKLPDMPIFVGTAPAESAGVDYLGLRATNLDLLSRCMPGINNVIDRVRCFSLLSWTIWRYELACEASGASLSSHGYREFREKIETLFVWSHQLAGQAAGQVGAQQSAPGGARVPLDFKSFRRTVTLLEAATYRPAMKDAEGGLGFATQADVDLYEASARGRALAQAFDAVLRVRLSADDYAFVASLTERACTPAQAARLFDAWCISEPSPRERAIVRDALYAPGEAARSRRQADRSAFLALVRRHLAASATPLSVAELRARLCTEPLPAGDDGLPDEPLAQARARWQVAQARQIQRLGLEAMFSWVEHAVWSARARSSAELVALMLDDMARPGDGCAPFDPERFVEATLQPMEAAGSAEALFAGTATASVDAFCLMRQLQAACVQPRRNAAVPHAAWVLLLLSAQLAVALARNPHAARHLSDASPARLPLTAWGAFVAEWRRRPFEQLASKLVEVHLISRHLGTVTARAADGRSRMRLALDDAGLVSLLGNESACLKPAPSPDRIAKLMALAADCGLAQYMGGRNDEARYSAIRA